MNKYNTTDDEFPEALQIEVTNRCNFNCQMCIRRVWKTKLQDLNLDLYRKIAESNFKYLKRLILYGLGEPFLNPDFLEMLKIAEKNLPKDSTIIISTNGSMLNKEIADKILRDFRGISLSFSIDTIDMMKLSLIREGSKPTIIMKNFKDLIKMRRRIEGNLKLGIETVIMRNNFRDLPQLIRSLAEEDIDYIIVSHAIPYSIDIFENTTYITLSKTPFEIINPSLEHGWKLIREATIELLSRAYGANVKQKSAEIIKNFWRDAEKAGYWINLPLLFKSRDKIELINEVEETFNESRKIAYENQIDLKLPNILPDSRNRICPYINKNTMIIRSDGIATPCLEFMYSHPLYINVHLKEIHEISYGDLRIENVKDIWNREEYIRFRDLRRNFNENIPWCGDCPYSTFKCFFIESNLLDCYTNTPTCNECLYSANLAQCNI